MTAKTATAKTPAWLRFSREVDAQCERNTTPAEVKAAYEAYLRNGQQGWVSNGAQTYRDRDNTYTVGYGGERNYYKPATTTRDYTPSDAQINFFNDLLVKREHNYTEAQIAEGRSDWRKIRPMIDELKVSARRDPRARQAEVEVVAEVQAPTAGRIDFKAMTDGNYAIPGEGDVIHFYRVSTKKNGFKKVQIRASDSLYDTRSFKQDVAILHQIVAYGLEESQMLFATKLERCWMCGRTLTNDVSRARGTGDECANK